MNSRAVPAQRRRGRLDMTALHGLLVELRRRNVLRAGVLHLAIWALAQQDGDIAVLLYDPFFSRYRHDARFAAL